MTAPTQTQLQSDLSGAIGCDFASAKNELFFVEFDAGKLSSLTVAPATPAYTTLGLGYNQPEDVRLSDDGIHAYVTERTGDLVRVALASANRSAAVVVATGMTAPQQLFLDEAHGVAYTVEYASPGSLVRIDLGTGAKTVVTTALDNPIGVVLSSDLQYAYVSEQTTGPDKGRISRVQLSSAARTTLATGLTSPFFLTWADAAQDSLYVPQRDPANSVVQVNVTSGTVNTVITDVPFRPSCVAVPYSGTMLICSDSVIESVSLFVALSDGPLLMGIGLIPSSDVDNTTGLATTPSGSPYYVVDAPFGGTLPIMVNFQSADGVPGALYYQVEVDGTAQTGSWTVYYWNGATYVLETIAAETIGASPGTPGCFPIHPVADLFLYQPPSLGYELDTTVLSNGLHTIVVQLLNSSGNPVQASEPMTVLVNNQPCIASLQAPVLNTTPPKTANSCGLLVYSDTSTTVSLPYTVSQPAGFATFSISLARGVTPVGPPPTLPSGAPVTAVASPVTATVADLIGTCPTAGFAVEVYVAATMTNGHNRQSQYDAEALEGFVLAKDT